MRSSSRSASRISCGVCLRKGRSRRRSCRCSPRSRRSARMQNCAELVSRTTGTLGSVLLVVTALGVLGADPVDRDLRAGIGTRAAREVPVDHPDLLRITFPFLMLVSLTALAGQRAQQVPSLRAARDDAGDPQPLHDRRCAVDQQLFRRADHVDGTGGVARRRPAAATAVARVARTSTCSRCRVGAGRTPRCAPHPATHADSDAVRLVGRSGEPAARPR